MSSLRSRYVLLDTYVTTFNVLYNVAFFRVAMRQQGDLIRTMYPKLILEGSSATFGGGGARSTLGGAGGGQDGTTQLSASVAALKRPPLARAVHLTLGKGQKAH